VTDAFPELLREFIEEGPAWDIIEAHDLDLEYFEAFEDSWKSGWGLDDEAAAQLHAFAMDGSGGMVCFWTYATVDLEVAPIVHIGSEGECALLAPDLGTFLALTALGFDPFALADGFTEPPGGEPPHERGLDWLDEHGITPPESVGDMLDMVRLEHPDIDEWVQEHVTI
jgi:hypothetical protein